MIKDVRKGLRSIVAWVFVALLVLSFALWGVPGLSNFSAQPTMKVGKIALAPSAIQSEYSRAFQRRREEAGGKFTPADAAAQGLGDQVVNQIATRSILEQEAAKLGLVMPASLVKKFIESNENFKNPSTGKFDDQALQAILQQNNINAAEFERLITNDLLRNQLLASVAAGAPAPKFFADAMLLRETELRRVGYLTITDDMAGPAKQPTPDDLKKYYEANKQQFTAPEYRTFTAAIVRPADFAGAPPPEEELKKLYDLNKARLYEAPERRTFYQVTYDDEASAKAAAASLNGKKPFEQIAAAKGLSLATVTFTETAKKDILDPAVAEATFAAGLQAGAVVGPVKGAFGWTVAQIAGITPPTTTPFEEVRAELVAKASEQETRKKVFAAVEAMEDARDTGAGLADAAKAAGAKIEAFGPVDSFSFAPGGAIVAELPGEVLAEAFKIGEGEESEAVELSDGGYFFVQVNEVQAPAALAYEDVAEEVAQKWRAEERKTRIAAAVKQVRDAVAAGKKLSDAAALFNRAILEAVLTRGRANDAISQAFSEDIFKADLNAVISGEAGVAGAQTIVEIREIGFGRNRISAGEETAFGQYLGAQLNQEYVDAYLAALREDYGVKVDKERLSELFQQE